MERIIKRLLFVVFILLGCIPVVSADPVAGIVNDASYLPLKSGDIHDLVDISYSTLFFKPKANMMLDDFISTNLLTDSVFESASDFESTIKPDFKNGGRRWIIFRFINETEMLNWKVHFSNFYIDEMSLVLFEENSVELIRSRTYSRQGENVDFNVLGRAFRLQLASGQRYILGAEIQADTPVPTPYIGLMSSSKYSSWASRIDLVYDLSNGVILGIVALAFTTGLIVRDSTFHWFALSTLLFFGFQLMRGPIWGHVLGLPYELGFRMLFYASLTALSFLLFAYRFLQISPADKLIYRSFRYLIIVTCFVPLLSTLLDNWWSILLYSVHAALLIVVILGAGIIRILKTGSSYNILYIAGWVPIGISLGSLILSVLISESGQYKTSLSYLFVFENLWLLLHIFIHAIAMVLRMKEIRETMLKVSFLNRAKSNFIAASSHDLRQPLHSMGMYISSLEDHVEDPQAKKLLNSISNSHQQMNQAFVSVMELSKLEAGVVSVAREDYPLSEIFNRLRVEFEKVAATKLIDLKIRGTDVVVNTDPLLLERMLRNILSNAIKYTDSGKVLMGLRRRGDKIIVQVFDTGDGIPAEKIGDIFDIYSRLSDSKEGIGIGLSIVKQMADLLNHNITVQSTVGKGTVFSLELPKVDVGVPVQCDVLTDHKPDSLAVSMLTHDKIIVEHFVKRFRSLEKKLDLSFGDIQVVDQIEINEPQLSSLLLVDATMFKTEDELVALIQCQQVNFSSVVIIETSAYSLQEMKRKRFLIVPRDIETIQMRALINYVERSYNSCVINELSKESNDGS